MPRRRRASLSVAEPRARSGARARAGASSRSGGGLAAAGDGGGEDARPRQERADPGRAARVFEGDRRFGVSGPGDRGRRCGTTAAEGPLESVGRRRFPGSAVPAANYVRGERRPRGENPRLRKRMAPVLRGQSAAFPSARGVEGGPYDCAAGAAAAVDARVPRASQGEVYVGDGVQVSARVVFVSSVCYLRLNSQEPTKPRHKSQSRRQRSRTRPKLSAKLVLYRRHSA